MRAEVLLDELHTLGIDFYTGVPDSQLKVLCDELYARYGVQGDRHIVAANEGAAVGLAAGHYLASGRPAMVYMQNSGIGNAVNPIASLLNPQVYGIPCVFVIGWRGEPGVHDEPQHIFQGQITPKLLEILEIPYLIVDGDTSKREIRDFCKNIKGAVERGESSAFIIKKGSLERTQTPGYTNSFTMTREEVVRKVAEFSGEQDIIVSTTGKASRELYEIREVLGQPHDRDFLTVGSMGHASMIAMGIALEKKDKRVWCIDGDGAAVMHMGSLAVEARQVCPNLIHIVLNNGAHETVGGMPVVQGKMDFAGLAESVGFTNCFSVCTGQELEECIKAIVELDGTKFIEAKVSLYSRSGLGRPASSPQENKKRFMEHMNGGGKAEGFDF